MIFRQDKIVFELSEGALDQAACLSKTYVSLAKGDSGAQSVFSGFVRGDEKAGDRVQAIEYTTYAEMVSVQVKEVLSEILDRNQLNGAWVFHSLGRVRVGECCLIVVAYAAHRRAAMEGCTELTEAIKKELPIWGKEIFSSQSESWKVNT